VTWHRVSRERPCPKCGRPTWCLIGDDGAALCKRVASARQRGEAGWYHPPDGVPPPLDAPVACALTAGRPRAADVDLDRVYRALLGRLPLYERHRQHLLVRGLQDTDLARAGYRSLPEGCRAGIVRHLRSLYRDELLVAVPGIVTRRGQRDDYLTLTGAPGLLIPVGSAAGLVVGLVVRPDDPGDGGKYRWLSGGGGACSGTRGHVPAGVQPSQRVVVTEGCLKADVAAALSGRSFIGLPGSNVTSEALQALRELGAVEALLALDSDAARNRHVAMAQVEGLRQLKEAGFAAGLVRWNPALGKGIDDMLLELRRRRRAQPTAS